MTTRPKTYWTWAGIKRRCLKPKAKQYKDYGGRGIKLQESWKENSAAFCQYVESLPSYAANLTLERKDNDGDYCEGNLRWATRGDQAKNRRKMSSNSSGITGVSIFSAQRAKHVDTYALAQWTESGVLRNKTFSVRKFGLLPAFAKAVVYRQQQLDFLRASGESYSSRHGL